MFKYVTDGGRAGGKVGLRAMAEHRESDGRKPAETGFEHRTYRAAVDDIDGGIAPIVDAGQDKVGTAGTEMFHTHLDTVDRRAVARIATPPYHLDRTDTQGSAGGDRGA